MQLFFSNLPLEKLAINCMCVYSNTHTHTCTRKLAHTHSDHQCCTKIQPCSCWGEFRVCVWTHQAVLPLMLQTVFPSINIMEMSSVFVLFFPQFVCVQIWQCVFQFTFGCLWTLETWSATFTEQELSLNLHPFILSFFLNSCFKGFWKEKNFRIYK